jgi:hypothetical protein
LRADADLLAALCQPCKRGMHAGSKQRQAHEQEQAGQQVNEMGQCAASSGRHSHPCDATQILICPPAVFVRVWHDLVLAILPGIKAWMEDGGGVGGSALATCLSSPYPPPQSVSDVMVNGILMPLISHQQSALLDMAEARQAAASGSGVATGGDGGLGIAPSYLPHKAVNPTGLACSMEAVSCIWVQALHYTASVSVGTWRQQGLTSLSSAAAKAALVTDLGPLLSLPQRLMALLCTAFPLKDPYQGIPATGHASACTAVGAWWQVMVPAACASVSALLPCLPALMADPDTQAGGSGSGGRRRGSSR